MLHDKYQYTVNKKKNTKIFFDIFNSLSHISAMLEQESRGQILQSVRT